MSMVKFGSPDMWPQSSNKYTKAIHSISNSLADPKFRKQLMKILDDRAKQINKNFNKKQKTETKRPAPNTPAPGQPGRIRRWGNSVGRYRGKFIRRRRKASKKTPTQTALGRGYHLTVEQYGTLTDSHIGYITHSTMHYTQLAKAICGAIYRRLFEKHGITISNKNEPIPLVTGDLAGTEAYFIEAVFVDVHTGQRVTEFNEIDANTMSLNGLIADFTAFLGRIQEYLYDDPEGGVSPPVLKEVLLGMRPQGLDPDVRRIVARLDMSREKMHVVFKSKLKVQNRTKGDSTPQQQDAEADRVDNAPLYGFQYQFSSAHPKLATKNRSINIMYRMNQFPLNGLTLSRGSEAGLLLDLREPPQAGWFSNCKYKNKVILQPGDIKETKLGDYKVGTFQGLMDKLSAKKGFYVPPVGEAPAEYGAYNVVGKSQMICLEEMIRSINSNEIILVYERQHEVGVWFSPYQPSTQFTTDFADVKIDDLQ